MIRFKKGQLYHIVWLDITTGNEWHTEDELDKWVKVEGTIVTSDWRFLKETKEWYLFYSAISNDADPKYYDVHCIPKGVIKKAWLIKDQK